MRCAPMQYVHVDRDARIWRASVEPMTAAEMDRRMAVLGGDVLDLAPDPVLQAVAAEAVEATGATWAAITLLLRHTVIYRAHFGLPRELANLYSTDRSASCCESVVETGRPLA